MRRQTRQIICHAILPLISGRPRQSLTFPGCLLFVCVGLGQSATVLMFACAGILCERENCQRLLAGFPRHPQTICDVLRIRVTDKKAWEKYTWVSRPLVADCLGQYFLGRRLAVQECIRLSQTDQKSVWGHLGQPEAVADSTRLRFKIKAVVTSRE